MYKVALVEDEFFVRLGIKHSVDWQLYNMSVVVEAENGDKAWAAIQQVNPDILITDLKMPGMSGVELIRNIAGSLCRPYIIVLTCVEEFHIARELLALGVRDYILKATMTEEVLAHSLAKAYRTLQETGGPAAEVTESPADAFQRILSAYLGGGLSPEETHAALSRCHINLADRKLAVVVGRIDEICGNMHNGASQQLVRGNLIDLLRGASHSCLERHVLHLFDDYFLLLYCFPSATKQTAVEEAVRKLLPGLQAELQDYLNIRLSLWAGCAGAGLGGLRPVLDRFWQMQGERHLWGMGALVYSWDYRPEELLQMSVERLNRLGEDCAGFLEAFQPTCYARLVQTMAKQARQAQADMMVGLFAVADYIATCAGAAYTAEKETSNKLLLERPTLPDCIGVLEALVLSIEVRMLASGSKLRPEIRSAIAYIRGYLHDPELDLPAVAAHIGLSESYFSLLFKQEMPMSFIKYLTSLRVEHAKELLKNTQEKVGAVAIRCGFASEAYFSKVFKKTVGAVPSEWRQY